MRKRSIFPAAANRDAWEKIAALPRNRKVLDNRTKLAEKVLDEEIPQLSASLFMEFARTGNRSNYEEKYFERRKNLSTLVIAECAEYKGRFIDHIIDYLWAICSEPLWGLPAHVKTPDNDPLPDPPIESIWYS